MRAGLALSVSLALAAAAAGCGEAPNRLNGSVSEIYSLDFDTVNASLIGDFLVVEYLRSSNGARTLKLSLDRRGVTVTSGQEIDLAAPTNTGTRGTLQRIVDGTTELPLSRGGLTLDQSPAAGARLVGSFFTTLSDPSGRTLNGAFDAMVVQK